MKAVSMKGVSFNPQGGNTPTESNVIFVSLPFDSTPAIDDDGVVVLESEERNYIYNQLFGKSVPDSVGQVDEDFKSISNKVVYLSPSDFVDSESTILTLYGLQLQGNTCVEGESASFSFVNQGHTIFFIDF